MKIFNPKLDFVQCFDLSRAGKIDQIKAEFDIIRICFSCENILSDEYKDVLDRIVIMPIRKLLCEKNSLLEDVCPNFKMLPFEGRKIDLLDDLYVTLPPLDISPQEKWISLEEWKNQTIAYFRRDKEDFDGIIPIKTYEGVCNSLKGNEKKVFTALFSLQDVLISGKVDKSYVLVNDCEDNREIAYNLMKKAGCYELNVYDFLKHLADKRGAHLDSSSSLLIPIINEKNKEGYNLVKCIAFQLIYASMTQIPELGDYIVDLRQDVEIYFEYVKKQKQEEGSI